MERKKQRSLKWQAVGIVLLCWLAPVALVLCVMSWYISDSLSQSAIENLDSQFAVNLQMCSDRLQSAVSASRSASSDPTIKNAWAEYQKGDHYLNLNLTTRSFLDRQYRSDNRVRFAVFWFAEDPLEQKLSVYNQAQGAVYNNVRTFWNKHWEAADQLASTLGTSIGFLSLDGEMYLVRNVMDSSYRPIGVLCISLNLRYYFDNLYLMPWASDIAVAIDGVSVQIKGEAPLSTAYSVREAEGTLWQAADTGDFTLAARAQVDYDVLLSQMSGYRYLLLGMGILLLPLLFIAVNFFNRKISRPIESMMSGAREIEGGKLGHQLTYAANSQEFQYLTDSFNHMSTELRNQFDRIYQEELALRDARIKALQSHINPHFLNNTLEIINWEARMNGDARVSKMIEALSTVLDAAIARDKRPEITLGEEMSYVNAYLYIITERFGKRVSIVQEIDESTLGCMVPRLILQPVIENAVEHGIGPGGKGTITIRSYLKDEALILETVNDGGLSKSDREQIDVLLSSDYDSPKEPVGNIGIANVNQRLRILYGGGSGLSIHELGGDQVVARLTIIQKNEC